MKVFHKIPKWLKYPPGNDRISSPSRYFWVDGFSFPKVGYVIVPWRVFSFAFLRVSALNIWQSRHLQHQTRTVLTNKIQGVEPQKEYHFIWRFFCFICPMICSHIWNLLIFTWAPWFYRFHRWSQIGGSCSKGILSNLGHHEFTVGYLWDDRLQNIWGPKLFGLVAGTMEDTLLGHHWFYFVCEIFVLYYWCLLFILISDPPVGTPSFYLAQYLKHHVLQSILRHWKHGVRWKGTPLFSSTGLAFAFSSFSRGKGSTPVPWTQSNMHRSIHPFFGCIAWHAINEPIDLDCWTGQNLWENKIGGPQPFREKNLDQSICYFPGLKHHTPGQNRSENKIGAPQPFRKKARGQLSSRFHQPVAFAPPGKATGADVVSCPWFNIH